MLLPVLHCALFAKLFKISLSISLSLHFSIEVEKFTFYLPFYFTLSLVVKTLFGPFTHRITEQKETESSAAAATAAALKVPLQPKHLDSLTLLSAFLHRQLFQPSSASDYW